MRSLNAAYCDRPNRRVENRVRVSRGALAGLEGEVVGEMDDDRVVMAVIGSDDHIAETVPGLYVFLPRETVEAADR